MTLAGVNVDAARLVSELETLAQFSDCEEPSPAVTRVVFTPTDVAARAYLRGLYDAAGLVVRVDPIGNTYARWVGSDESAPAIGTGSHCDAIPHSGMYDGTVGVLGGLEAIRALMRAGYQPRRSIEVVMFTSEEPTRFGVGCTGSRMMSGQLDAAALVKLHDEEGLDYDAARTAAGFTGSLDDARLPPDYYDAFVELHIEQGPELEAAGLPIGVVTAIAAPAQFKLSSTGEGGHAGGVLMPRRKDALCAAAELTVAIERIAKTSASPDLVATVGRMQVHPGAVNSIPSRVDFTLDLRDIALPTRQEALGAIRSEANAIACRRSVEFTIETVNADPPATCDYRIIAAVESACGTLGHASQQMISRAYHDSLFMAQVCPTGMIFIPCRGGVSHRPDEFSSPEQLQAGVEALALTLAALAK